MARVTFSLEQLAEERARLAENFMPAVMRGLASGGARCVALMQQATAEAPPANPAGIGSGGAVDRRNYLRRWKAVETRRGVRITNSSPYAAVIENGRRPGARMPPVDAIMGWVMRKLVPKNIRGRAKRENWARGVAWAIARAIKRRGLLARRVMGNRVQEMTAIMHEEIRAELAAAMEGRAP